MLSILPLMISATSSSRRRNVCRQEAHTHPINLLQTGDLRGVTSVLPMYLAVLDIRTLTSTVSAIPPNSCKHSKSIFQRTSLGALSERVGVKSMKLGT